MRKLAPRFLLLLGGTILALCVGEVLTRVFWDELRPLRDVEIDYPMGFPAPLTGVEFGLIPGSEFEGKYDGDPYGTLPADGTIRYRINESGFRDREFKADEAATGLRIMVLGDSFAFGEGVSREDRFTEIMGASLRADRQEPVTTLNCAIPGYSSRDEAALAEVMVPWLKPEVVLLAYCLNDPVHISEKYPAFDLIMLRDLGGETDPSRDSVSRLLRLIRHRLGVRRVTGATLDWYRELYSGPRSAWVRSRIYLAKMRDVAKQSGARFVVAIQPILTGVGKDYPFAAAHREIADWCRAQGIPVIDLQPAFAGNEAKDLIVHPKDHHPNARAHRIMGEALATFLEDQVLGR